MAYSDYGAIAFKNGRLISTDTFTPMIDTVGWEDTEETLCYYCKRDRLGKRQFAHWPLHVQLCSTHRYSGLSILLFCTGFFPPSCTYAFFPPLAYLSEKGRREIIQ